MNLENVGPSGVDPSVLAFCLKKAHMHEIGQCLQFTKALEANEGC